MKSTTEEYQAAAEELQSSNEELETAKEELQSINEELQTINGELQSKNDALESLNSDMKNLLDSTQIATVFLDDALRIKHYTPVMEQLFSLREVDRGRGERSRGARVQLGVLGVRLRVRRVRPRQEGVARPALEGARREVTER